ncbi:MAG: Nif3-like dinuclear metal center hexameric protein [Chlamydiia bacterium]|nr:Nif3-like dinuclear metal center hexameric protein [Chlamydiia bacterium]
MIKPIERNPKIQKVVDWVNEEFDLDIEDVCMNGIYVDADVKDSDCNSIITAVYPSDYVIEKAVELKASIIITHHSLWRKNQDVQITGLLHSKIKKLLDNNIMLISMHAPIDRHETFGHSFITAREIGCVDVRLQKIKGLCFAKAKFNGSVEDLEKRCIEFFGRSPMKAVFGESANNVYILSGGGSRFFGGVIDQGADCYITGTSDEPNWYAAEENKVSYFSFGHYTTEKCGMIAIGDFIGNNFDLSHTFVVENNVF